MTDSINNTASNNNTPDTTAINNTNDLIKAQKPTAWWLKKKFSITVAMLGLLAVLIMLNINIVKYETHLATGETVLLELAPVDPRGFMQGDYMALSYALEREVFNALQPKSKASQPEPDEFDPDFRIRQPSEGYVIVKIDTYNVGHFVRLADDVKRDNLATNEMPIHYRIRNGGVQLATNAFFFQEGHAEAFEAAEYGLFRVNDKGEPLLTEMVNGEFEIIKSKSSLDVKTSN